jgi:hypothetical protein
MYERDKAKEKNEGLGLRYKISHSSLNFFGDFYATNIY